MPDIQHLQALLWHRITAKAAHFLALVCSNWMLMLFAILILPGSALGDATSSRGGGKNADPNGYDIGIIIDNREIAGTASAKEDVKALADMLDRHMFAEHIIRLERPSFPVICDIFGGCPNEADHVWPSLIARITDREQSRLFVYYLGPARTEGRERQFLFEDGPGRRSPYAVGWLHKQLEKTGPKSVLVMIEASFAPRPLSCTSETPLLIDGAMKTVQRNYVRIMEGRYLPDNLAELSATMPAQLSHCDRFELTSDDVKRPLFTKFLLKGVVEGLADKDPFGDEDGTIELGELATYTHSKIRRAVQFQWGRRQTVWQVGPGSQSIARVEARKPTSEEKKVRGAEEPREAVQPKEERKPESVPEPDKNVRRAPGEHVCDQDQNGEACLEFCAGDPGNFRCGFIGVSTCVDRPVSDGCPCVQNDPRPGGSSAGSWCRRSGTELASGARGLISTLGGQPSDVCQWATRNETKIASGVLWKLFAPIGWRLIRPSVRPSVACMLNCRAHARQVTAPLINQRRPDIESVKIHGPNRVSEAAGNQRLELPEQSPKTAFNNEVCDRSLPPYIALPRWMPGTLLVSEAFSLYSGCHVSSGFQRFARSMPPPVILVEAPPVPQPTYRPPPPFTMPPPIKLPPVERLPVALPGFEPTVAQIRWLQSALMLGNFDPGPIDGVVGDRTEAAIERWRRGEETSKVTGALTALEFKKVVTEFGDLFDQAQQGAPLY